MTSEKHNLSPEQKELVAVGASVGAGCQPCVSHHLKAGAKEGLGGEQLLAAVTSAEWVTAEAAVAMDDHVRGWLGPDVSSPALLSRLEEALASLGAALGANDATNIERQLRAAGEQGVSRSQLEQALETAHTVQENAARIHLDKAEDLLVAVAPAVAAGESETQSSGCGCAADDEESEPASRGAETPQAVGTTRGSGCGSMAAQFGTARGFGAMAGCRELFERFASAAAPEERNQAPTATAAAGSCEKEV